ncbi:MAG TPA: glycoside hydrolase family 2 protein [Chloroflexia bacterium]|nr:glycoside hydrolase family 2 protein [Chloroflexia bacterium]
MNSKASKHLSLKGEWRLKDFEPGGGEETGVYSPEYKEQAGEWIPAAVPGDVHTSLLAAGRIPEPFYHTNVEEVQWVEEREWWYRTTFSVPFNLQEPGGRDFLVFDGLDTYATLYLNGSYLGQHQNMFREARFDVTGKLKPDQPNLLAVRFDPVSLHLTQPEIPGQWGDYNARERVYARKTQSHFSWDWAPRLVNVGIWQEVRLEHFSKARLLSPYFRTLGLDKDRAILSLSSEVERWENSGDLSMQVSLRLNEKELVNQESGLNGPEARLVFELANPELWWPQGYGKQPLYDLTVTLKDGGKILDVFEDRVGVCQVTLDRSQDSEEPGCEFFTFVVNGTPIFAKGANWIPADSLNGRVDRERYAELLKLLVEANGNMLRVWGGGQYERDDFYKLADELGILIWHDFMFACGLYPDFEPGFVAEVRSEVEYQVRRLRNHPCLALWVGNNEVDWAEDKERWDQPGHDFAGKRLYHELISEIVERLDPAHVYWPSSPYGGNDHNGEQAGDRHNWYVWHGGIEPRRFGELPERNWSPEGVSYRHYGEDQARFISEFGIHALPVLETIQRNVPESECYFGSPGLLFRNKDNPKDKGNMLMQAHTGLPGSLEQYIDFSMITQAEGLKYGIEHYRRRKFHCSGTLIWQWNDCWPGLSWSVLDYYAFPKAGYFYLKRAYAPVLASFKEETDGAVTLWLTNDTLKPYTDTLTWQLLTFDGNILAGETVPAAVERNSSKPVAHLPAGLLAGVNRRQTLLRVQSSSGGLPENRLFLAEFKDLERTKPAVTISWEESGSGLLAHLSSSAFAYFTWLAVPLEGTRYSDNWVDLYPGESRTIKIWHPEGKVIRPEMVRTGWL